MKKLLWFVWSLLTLVLLGYLGMPLLSGGDKSIYLTGDATHGHYQIELECNACHIKAFGGPEALQDACTSCHEEELNNVHDSHPKSKFTDPRNADRVAILDARYCSTCHQEHQLESTQTMGVTLASDFCFRCHASIAEERPSHEGLEFNSCDNAGCHNYHDNRALYEDFLTKNAHQPDLLEKPNVLSRNALEHHLNQLSTASPAVSRTALGQQSADAPTKYNDPKTERDWHQSQHAQAGVNCSGCHQPTTDQPWQEKPAIEICADCHTTQTAGFLRSKHGMRLAATNHEEAMTPDRARHLFKNTSLNRELNCQSCHSDHRFDTSTAAIESCLSCHDDQHSNAYKQSPHFAGWLANAQSDNTDNAGVSCATCHLPREIAEADSGLVTVNHNQNDTLRPNEKMIRAVCMNCHSLSFSLDALADTALIKTNFNGKPSKHIESIEMALERAK